MKKPSPKQKNKNPVINTEPELEDSSPTLAAKSLVSRAKMTLEELEALEEAKKNRSKSSGKRRAAPKRAKKSEAYAALKKMLLSGSISEKKIKAIHGTLKQGNPKSIARIVKQAASEMKAKRSAKYYTKKISAEAIKAERKRVAEAKKRKAGAKKRKEQALKAKIARINARREKAQSKAAATLSKRVRKNAKKKAAAAPMPTVPHNPPALYPDHPLEQAAQNKAAQNTLKHNKPNIGVGTLLRHALAGLKGKKE